MSAAELVLLVTLPLLGVIAQLQRVIPLFKRQVTDTSETRAGVRAIVRHFGVKVDESPIATTAKGPDAA